MQPGGARDWDTPQAQLAGNGQGRGGGVSVVGRGGARSSPFPGWPLLLGCHCCPLEPPGRGAPGHCGTTRLMWGPRGCIRREPSSACQLQPPAQASPTCPAACQPMPPNSGTRSPRGLFLANFLPLDGVRRPSAATHDWSSWMFPWRPPPRPLPGWPWRQRWTQRGLEGRGGRSWH